MEILGKYIAAVLVVLGVIIGSSVISAGLFDEVTQERVEGIVNKFTSEVREQGKITKSMYDAFINELDATGNIYKIEMVYTKNVIMPSDVEGTAVETDESFYTDDILAGIYRGAGDGGAAVDGSADGEVHFTAGSYFSMSVSNANKTWYQSIAGIFHIRSAAAPRIEVHHGGEIRDENW